MWELAVLLLLDWLILQVPYAAVFEGEPLVMRCRGWYDKIVYKLHYYHDGQPVRYFHSSANYTVPQARASDSGRYQCSGTMRIPVESAPMFSAKVAVTVQELFQAPVLRVTGRVEARGAAFGGVVLRCETRLHPQKRDTPLQFAFYKYSRPVRRYDWDAEYTVPEPEVEELESYWCEAATATRSVRKRSPWLQLPGRGSPLDLASTTAPVPGNQPLSFRKPPVSRSVPSVPSVPNVTSAGPPFPAGGAPTAGPPACAPPTPLRQTAGALKPDVALLLREMQLLQGLLSRVVLELKETQAFPGHTVETSTSHSAHTLSAMVQEIDAQGPASQHYRDPPESTGITDIAAAEETKSIIHLVSRSHRNCRSTASASLSPSICRLRASEWPDLAAGES
uniref:Immunoglobulin domain-containing protein n=1 Tax=Capra hircus TaxID=9925 RepID=A0A8C2NC34_CAPHI